MKLNLRGQTFFSHQDNDSNNLSKDQSEKIQVFSVARLSNIPGSLSNGFPKISERTSRYIDHRYRIVEFQNPLHAKRNLIHRVLRSRTTQTILKGEERRRSAKAKRKGRSSFSLGRRGLHRSNQTWKQRLVLTRIHCELPFRIGTSGRLPLTSLYRRHPSHRLYHVPLHPLRRFCEFTAAHFRQIGKYRGESCLSSRTRRVSSKISLLDLGPWDILQEVSILPV